MACVFQFPSPVCAAFPELYMADGTTPRYWRMKQNQVKWSIKVASIYGISFECREAM
jgi:hypothetical protein